MRDPNRIPQILEKVRRLWEANPDWRLGQLLINAIDRVAPFPSGQRRFFYLEDEILGQGLDSLDERYGSEA